MKPTKVIKKKIISLDIGDKNIKVAAGKSNNGKLAVMDTFMIPTPERSVEDGNIRDMDILVQTIGSELNERKHRNAFMNVSFHSTQIIDRELVLPVIKSGDLKEMIQYEIQQYLPIDVDKYVMQYKIIEELTRDSRQFYRIIVTVIEKMIVEAYMELINRLGYKPYRFDVHTNALDKMIWYFTQSGHSRLKKKTVAVIDFGHKLTNVVIFEDTIFQMSQVINYGGHNMDILLEQRTGLDRSEIVRLKENLNEISFDEKLEQTQEQFKKAVKESLNTGVKEIQGVFRYYMSRASGNSIDEVIIYGGLASMKGIVHYLSEVLNMPVGHIQTHPDLNNDLGEVSLDQYLNVIGTILTRRS